MREPGSRSATDEIRVLYVDDDTAFADVVADFLEHEDDRFALTTASTAEDGLDRLATDAIDCVVSEYELPRMDGLEFLDAVRSTSDSLPFVLFPGSGSEDLASAAISAGVTDYLPKHDGPDRLRTLARRIAHAVERWWERRERQRRLDALETAETDTDIRDERDRFTPVHEADRSGYDPDGTVGTSWRDPEDAHATNAHGGPIPTRDPTEQAERERAFERTSALLSTLFDTLPVGVLAENSDRTVMAVNQRLFDLFGIPGDPSEAVGMDCERMAEESSELFVDPAGFVERIEELIAEGESVRREEVLLADGRTFERSYRPIDCPNGDGHLWVYHDSTDRKKYERRLEVLNETTRELMAADSFESVAETGVAAARDVLDLEANAIHLYDDAQSGLVPIAATDTLSDLVGEPPTFTGEDSIAWRIYERGETLALDNVRDDPDVYNPETAVIGELYLPIGEYGLLIAGSPTSETFDEQDEIIGEILTANVATALEQVEQTEWLRTHERELTRQNERLEEFTSIVSHDLQNPLSVATGHLELAMEEYTSERLDAVARAHDRMQALIGDLLTVAREGETATDIVDLSLAEIAERCWQNVETGEATLVVGTDRTVRADERRLRHLFENLFRNAVEHGASPPASPTRRDTADDGGPVAVTIGELEDGFYVEDDGPGIPSDERDRVFEFGYSTSREGTGFGLSIVKQVAEAHNWSIRVTDGAEGGARFEITGIEIGD